MKSQRNHSRHSRVSLLAALGVSALLCLPAAWAKDTEDGASAEDWLESLEPGARVNALVSYKEGNLAEILAHVEALDGDTGTLLKDRRLVSVNAKAEALMELLRSGLVLSMEHDVARFMYGSGQDYHRTLVQAQQLPFAGMTIPDEFADTLTVCIIDSGLDIHHPDLALTRVTGESAPDKGLLVPQTVGDWFVDEIGHGTHVAGIVAALDNNIGATGIAPNDRIALHIVKVFGPGYETTSAEVIYAVDACVAAGADIINMSLGSGARSSNEEQAMRDAADAGVLLVAAAGNDGDATLPDGSADLPAQTAFHYPASYDTVISVAAVDEQLNLAPFSQRNAQVELAAPGVDVYSTVPPYSTLPPATLLSGIVINENLRFMRGGQYVPVPNTVTNVGFLIDCGYGTSTCQPAYWEQPHIVGGVFGCLIERGPANNPITFAAKALACEAAGGTLAVIYNNESGDFSGTLNNAPVSIPVLEVSGALGSMIARQQMPYVGVDGVENPNFGVNILRVEEPPKYTELSGTSMASPVVAGVAALVWSHYRHCSPRFIRRALGDSALDLGAPGRDDSFGHGLVQHIDTINDLEANPFQICTL